MAKDSRDPVDTRSVDDFLVEPTRELSAWRWLWEGDRRFPLRSHRGLLGRLIVLVKRLLRPLVKAPQSDLWDRQRTFNLILLEHLQGLEDLRVAERLGHLEGFLREGVGEIMRHNDALFARVDQKLDRHRREVRDLTASLGAALARVEEEGAPARRALERARHEQAYLELEQRHRGTEEEITARLAPYLPILDRAHRQTGGGAILDLGCGRGEVLSLLGREGLPARGVDASARMVAHCREQGLEAEEGDLLEVLSAAPEEQLGAIVSFHVIEHLEPETLDRLVRLSYRALRPGGALLLETPNPLSLVAGSRNFWLDPTHRRPVHPEALRLLYELAGFTAIEPITLRPFPAAERLPEIDLAELPQQLHALADRINRLRDHLDELLYGAQDYAVVGWRASGEDG